MSRIKIDSSGEEVNNNYIVYYIHILFKKKNFIIFYNANWNLFK